MNSSKPSSNWLKNALGQLRDMDSRERAIQVQILDLLLEIERRKAYSELGYDGLYSFCVREMRWTESQSYQRIQAMYAIRSAPEIKNKIGSGVMSVTTVAQVQVMLRQDQVAAGIKRTDAEKLELFQTFEGKTTREVKSQIAEMRGERIVTKLTIELDEEASGLWQNAHAKVAHQSRGSDLQCLKVILREWAQERERASDPRRSISGSIGRGASTGQTTPTGLSAPKQIPAQIRRLVLERDHNTCQNCGSKYALQLDHIEPRAKSLHRNGDHSLANLRTLCRNCNLHFAIKEFGAGAVKRA